MNEKNGVKPIVIGISGGSAAGQDDFYGYTI